MDWKRMTLVVGAVAVSAALSAHGRTISENYTLTQDEDWTSDGTILFADSPTIDLNGHNLTVAGKAFPSCPHVSGVFLFKICHCRRKGLMLS